MKSKPIILLLAVVVSISVFAVAVAISAITRTDNGKDNLTVNANSEISSTESVPSEEEPSSSEETESVIPSEESPSSEAPVTSKNPTTSSKNPTTSNNNQTTVVRPITNELFPGYKYNTGFDMENNVFLDALRYTGYNLEKHRADGQMWNYILSSDKKWRGWLSKITYGGGSTGLETTAEGLPNIAKFEKGGLVCASFASYVYFNYLPNVAGIDTSSLDIPEQSYSAASFHAAAKKWVEKGYSYNIGFKAKNGGSGIIFEPDEEIPLGSIIVFRDLDKPSKTVADHITVYVGKKNGYHWVIQTGNKNGPEFCAVERFKFGPGPQFPLAIFATPTCIYDALGELTSGAAN